MSLVLASGSPRRKELLALITPDFVVRPSGVAESAITAPTPAQLALALGTAKCLDIAAQAAGGDTVVGCDTVVECGGEVFGKPKSKEDARRMLRALAGADHYVHTGVCLARGGERRSFTATTRVRFYPLSGEQIEAYIATPEPYDKAGGYGIQGAAAVFCEGIEGCYYNVMGLPVARLARELAAFGALG